METFNNHMLHPYMFLNYVYLIYKRTNFKQPYMLCCQTNIYVHEQAPGIDYMFEQQWHKSSFNNSYTIGPLTLKTHLNSFNIIKIYVSIYFR